MTTVMSYAGRFGIIAVLYAVKPILLHRCRTPWLRTLTFMALLACAVPMVYILSTDWNNTDVSRLAPLIGDPIIVLTVPLLSFLFDARHPDRTFFPHWKWRVPLEIILIVPLWGAIWIAVEFFLLDWVWF